MTTTGDCFRCGEPGHWAANCPMLVRAAEPAEHLARIGSFVAKWIDGQMSTEEKRIAIGQENMLWYGDACPIRLRYP